MARRIGYLLVAVVVVAAAAVGYRAWRGPATQPAIGDDRGGEKPLAAIEGFDTAPEAGFGPRARLNMALISNPEATRQAALDRIESTDADVRIAAVYALSVTLHLDDANTLASLLESPNSGERVLAAAGMLAVGDKRAIPVLIGELDDDAVLPFGSRPARVWEQARFALLQSTGQDFGLRKATTAAEAAATMPAWQAWWTRAETSFAIVPARDPFGR
jgi:hypothetical protein